MFSQYLFFFQAEDGIRDLVRSRGLGDVYKRQALVARALGAQRVEDRHRLGDPALRTADHQAVAILLSLIHI